MLTAAPAPRPHPHFRQLVAKYDGRAPRYTSYPPATEFTPAVGADQYRQWLRALDPHEAISLYIHVPFCKRLCWYCGCNTKVVNNPALISRYVNGLRDELVLLEEALPGRLPVRNIHIGGGTPNILSRDDLLALFDAVRHVFDVRPGAEISVEADPSVLTPAWATAAAYHGVNRVSLGVQDLNPVVQKAVNRIETFDQLHQAVEWLRAADIERINFDLMYGLPKQTVAGLLQTIDQALTLRPDRIALFGYAHVPWVRPHQKLIDERALPDTDGRTALADAAAARLAAAGYVRIGLDHFARAEDSLAKANHSRSLRRNFQGYTDDPHETLLPLGVSAIGRLPQGYVQNAAAEIGWRAALDLDEFPIVRGAPLTEDDRFRGEIIESLLCHLGVDLDAVCHRHGRPAGALWQERLDLEDFVRDGLLTQRGHTYHVTEVGRPFARAICAVFDTYHRAGTGRFSRIV